MKNELVLENFLRGNKANNPSKNLVSNGSTLDNYCTTIAKHYGGLTLVNGYKYSSTTSKHQNYLKANSFCVVVDKLDFQYLIESDYDIAYDTMQDLYALVDGTCVDLTSTLKRDKPLIEEAQKILYKNKK